MRVYIAAMRLDDVIRHYGSQRQAALAIELTPQAVNNWRDRPIPIEWQVRWEVATDGALRADLPATMRCSCGAVRRAGTRS